MDMDGACAVWLWHALNRWVLKSILQDGHLRQPQSEPQICGSMSTTAKNMASDLFVNAAPVTDEPLKNAVNFLPTLEGCSLVFDHELVGTELIKYCRANNVIHIPGKSNVLATNG